MLYENTLANMDYLVEQLGYVTKKQLIAFFSDEGKPDILSYYIDDKIRKRDYDYDEKTDIIHDHKLFCIKDDEIKRRIKAFYVVQPFRSRGIQEIALAPYPSQIFFISSDNECYDVTVVGDVYVAQIYAQTSRKHVCEGVEDVVNHVALIPKVSFKEELKKANYGFDCYCVLDANKNPRYYAD